MGIAKAIIFLSTFGLSFLAFADSSISHICDSANILEFKKLVKSGSDLNQPLPNGKTCLIQAIELEQGEIVDLLMKNSKTNFNYVAPNGETALWAALEAENHKVTQLLLNLKPNLDLKLKDSGDTLLHLLSRKGQLSLIRKYYGQLVKNLNSQNAMGETPLMTAVVFEQIPVVKFLLSKKPNLELKNNTNQTAHDLAKKIKNKSILGLFKN